jgi:hypothetical protein
MKNIVLGALSAILLPLALAATPASARNYDCTKAGNANKAVCKGVAPAAPKPAPASTPAAAPKTTRVMHYDCSKAGNANKAACKGAAATPAPAPMAPPARPAPRPTAAAPAPSAAPRAPTGQATAGRGPDGATAKCRDNTYSHSAHRSGTCSRHGGVAQFY